MHHINTLINSTQLVQEHSQNARKAHDREGSSWSGLHEVWKFELSYLRYYMWLNNKLNSTFMPTNIFLIASTKYTMKLLMTEGLFSLVGLFVASALEVKDAYEKYLEKQIKFVYSSTMLWPGVILDYHNIYCIMNGKHTRQTSTVWLKWVTGYLQLGSLMLPIYIYIFRIIRFYLDTGNITIF